MTRGRATPVGLAAIYCFFSASFFLIEPVFASCLKDKNAAGEQWKEGEVWIDKELLMQCKNGTRSIANCIKQTSTSEFFRVGFEYDDGPARKKCTDQGVHVINCLRDGLNVEQATFLLNNGLLQQCSPSGLKNVGCQHNGARVQFGETFVGTSGAGRLQCTENGLVNAVQCNLKRIGQLKSGQTATDFNGVNWLCSNQGLQATSCKDRSGDTPLGEEAIDQETGMVKRCTKQGFDAARCVWQGPRYNVDQEIPYGKPTLKAKKQLDCMISRRCSVFGVDVEHCLYNAVVVEDGLTATVNGLRVKCDGEKGIIGLFCESIDLGPVDYGTRLADDKSHVTYECTAAGLQKLGCAASDDGSVKEFDAIYTDASKRWKCTGEGPVPYGCIDTSNNGKYYEIGAHKDQGGFRYRCRQDGSFQKEGCVYNGQQKTQAVVVISMGQEHEDGTLLVSCDDDRTAYASGCKYKGQSYEISIKPINDGSLRLQCTSNGIEKIGCIYKDTVIPINHCYDDNGLEVSCNETGSTSSSECKTKKGERFVFGARTEEGGVWVQCDKGFGWREITCQSRVISAPLKVGDTITEGQVRKKCTENGELKPIGCIRSDMEAELDQLLQEKQKLVWLCTETGFVKHGCQKDDGSIAQFGTGEYREKDLILTCENSGVKTQACVYNNNHNNVTLRLHQVTNSNGLQLICTDDGIKDLGCPLGRGKSNVPVDSEFEKQTDMKHKCTTRGALAVACRWTDGSWKTVGQQLEKDGVLRKCTDRGWTSLGCQDKNGQLAPIGTFFDKDGFQKVCNNNTATIRSCYYENGEHTKIDLDKTFTRNGLVVRCAAEGVQQVGCTSEFGSQPVGHDYEEKGLSKKCTAQGIQLIGCITSTGTQPIGAREYEDKGMYIDCTSTGPVPKGCKWQNGKKTIGQTFIVNGLLRQCTADGSVILGCPSDTGIVQLNSGFTQNGLRKNCTDGGAVTGDCLIDDGSALPVNTEKLNAAGLSVKCLSRGLEVLGCPKEDKGTAPVKSVYIQHGVVKTKCSSKGPKPLGCVTKDGSSNSTVAIDATHLEKSGLQLRCTKTGWQKLGCRKEDNKPLVALGYPIQDERWAYNCTENGLIVNGCISSKGAAVVRRQGETFVEDGLQKTCDLVRGVEARACVLGTTLLPVGNAFEEHDGGKYKRICKRCSSANGAQFSGCVLPAGANWRLASSDSSSLAMGPVCVQNPTIAEGQLVTEGELVRVCTLDGLKITKCLFGNSEYLVGQAFDGATIHGDYLERFKCTDTGIQLEGCTRYSFLKPVNVKRKSSKQGNSKKASKIFIPINSTGTVEGQLIQCDKENIGNPVGCIHNGQQYPLRATVDQANKFRFLCTRKGMERSCIYKPGGNASTTTEAVIVQLDKIIQQGTLVLGCNSHNGLIPRHCTFKMRTYKFGRRINDGGFHYDCTKKGIQRRGCIYKNITITDGTEHEDNGLIVLCSANGITADRCRTAEGRKVVIGETSKEDGVWKRCTDAIGWKEVTCASPVSNQGLLLKVDETVAVDGKLRKQCTNNGQMKPIGCIKDNQEKSIGETLVDESNWLVWECTSESGFAKLGCRKHYNGSEIIAIGAPKYQENGLVKVCREDGSHTTQCIAFDGTAVRIGVTETHNGLRIRCNDDGIENVGCFSADKLTGNNSTTDASDTARFAAVNAELAIGEVKYTCTARGLISKYCRWVGDQWKPVGSHVDQMGVKRRCTNDGWRSEGCPDDKETLQNVGSRFDKDMFRKLCTKTAAVVQGCYYLTKATLIPVDKQHNFNGILVKCTAEGTLTEGCPSTGGMRHVQTKYEENKLAKQCTDNGVLVLGCPTSKEQPQKIGLSYEDKGILYNCTANGAFPLGCRWQDSIKKVGETFIVHGVSRRCTADDGIFVEGCPGDGGVMAKLNTLFSVAGLKKNCTEGGAKTGGCYMPDGSLVTLGRRQLNNEGLLHECQTDGLKVIGCPTGRNDSTVPIGASFYGGDDTVVLHSCTEHGPKPAGCRAEDQSITKVGEPFFSRDLKFQCTETGFKLLGCSVDEDGDTDEDVVVGVGKDFHDDEWGYTCTETGIMRVGCVYDDVVRAPGKVFNDDVKHLKLECDMDSGIERLGCIVDGNEVPMDGNYEQEDGAENSKCWQCTSSGILFHGCIMHSGRQWQYESSASVGSLAMTNPLLQQQQQRQRLQCKQQERVENSAQVIENRMVKGCTPEGFATLFCFIDGKKTPIGHTFPESGVTKECSVKGIVEKKGPRRYKVAIQRPKAQDM